MLGAFFDDSGTHDGAPVLTVGGLLGTDAQWNRFAAAWTALLAHPLDGMPPLKQFHLSPCRAGSGEFLDYNEAERNRITFLFRRLIIDIDMVTIAAAVDKAAWNELVVGDMHDRMGDAIGYCYVKCVDLVLSTIRLRKPGEKVMIAFDQGTKRHLEEWSRYYQMQPDRYPEIETIFFAPVNKVVALQGADMIATETFYYAQQWFKDGSNATPNPHFAEFMRRELSAGIVLDREAIADLIEKIRHSEVPA